VTYAILACFVGLLWLISYGIIAMLKESARNEERAKSAMRDNEVIRKQAEEMLKERSVEDVARDLDGGRY